MHIEGGRGIEKVLTREKRRGRDNLKFIMDNGKLKTRIRSRGAFRGHKRSFLTTR